MTSSVPRVLTNRQRRGLRLARDWIREDTSRTSAAALRDFKLDKSLNAYLRVLRAADRHGIRIDITRETPRFMYALVFWESELVKVGVALRDARPRTAVSKRIREHVRVVGEEVGEWFWWAGSLEAEQRLLRRLGKPVVGREWFRLTPQALQKIENTARRSFTRRTRHR